MTQLSPESAKPHPLPVGGIPNLPWGSGPIPAGWFTEPVRAWWPDFISDLCTAGRPLCILTPAAILAEKRGARLSGSSRARVPGMRPYKFRRLDGVTGATERIWRHLREHGGVLPADQATKLTGYTRRELRQYTESAVAAGVLIFDGPAAAGQYALGPVVPTSERTAPEVVDVPAGVPVQVAPA